MLSDDVQKSSDKENSAQSGPLPLEYQHPQQPAQRQKPTQEAISVGCLMVFVALILTIGALATGVVKTPFVIAPACLAAALVLAIWGNTRQNGFVLGFVIGFCLFFLVPFGALFVLCGLR